MNELVELVGKVLEEHCTIKENVQAMEQMADDVSVAAGLEVARDTFMPGRLDRGQGLQKLQELLKRGGEGIEAHFNREETALLEGFERYGDREFVSGLRSLLGEHGELRKRFAEAKKQVANLTSGNMARHLWEASAGDMRAYLSHTRKRLEEHAEAERELLMKMQRRLKEKENQG